MGSLSGSRLGIVVYTILSTTTQSASAQSCAPLCPSGITMDVQWRWQGSTCTPEVDGDDCRSIVSLEDMTGTCGVDSTPCTLTDSGACGGDPADCIPDPLVFDLFVTAPPITTCIAMGGVDGCSIGGLDLVLNWDPGALILSGYSTNYLDPSRYAPCEATGTCPALPGEPTCVIGDAAGCEHNPASCAQEVPTTCYGNWIPHQSTFPEGLLDLNVGGGNLSPFDVPDNDGDALWTLFAPFGVGIPPAVVDSEMHIGTFTFELVLTGGQLPASTSITIPRTYPVPGGLFKCSEIVTSEGQVSGCSYTCTGPETCPTVSQLGSATILLTPCLYDIDLDTCVTPGDFAFFGPCWLTCDTDANWTTNNCAASDFDCSGCVDPGDISFFSTGWLKCCDDPSIVFPPAPCGLEGGPLIDPAPRDVVEGFGLPYPGDDADPRIKRAPGDRVDEKKPVAEQGPEQKKPARTRPRERSGG